MSADTPPPVVASDTPAATTFLSAVVRRAPELSTLAALGWMLANEVDGLSVQVADLSASVHAAQLDAALTAGDRWTRSEQAAYAEAIQARLVSLEVSP